MTTVTYTWLPEDELVAAVRRPDRATLVVAAAVDTATTPPSVLVVTGDGKVAAASGSRFGLSEVGDSPDCVVVRPVDGGRAVLVNRREAVADVLLYGLEFTGTLFDPADYDGTKPDPHATPEQVPLLDRLVAITERAGDAVVRPEDRDEWRATIAVLHKTIPGLYGSEWVHRGWNLMLHGSQMFSDRWTPEVHIQRVAWWEKFLAGPKPHYKNFTPARVPLVGPEALR